MKTLSKFLMIVLLTTIFFNSYAQTLKSATDLYDSLLKKYVKEGKVNYKQLCKDEHLNKFINFLSNYNPDSLTTKNEALAFWINAYNAYTIKTICKNYPLNSITELKDKKSGKSIWDQNIVKIGDKLISLNYIENNIIRKKFKDNRIHFALVCAAKSCPSLRSEAYLPEKLDAQLTDQGQIFLQDTSKNKFNFENNIAQISSLFQWYASDFGKDETELLNNLFKYVNPKYKLLTDSTSSEWKINYLNYNWSLNSNED